VIALALGAAVAANPNVISQFVEAVRNPAEGAVPLSGWTLPVPSYWLRMWLAPEHFWVQFVPCALACAGFLAYRFWKGAAWDWSGALPLVVAVSLIVTPYGGWIFDLPVLLVTVVYATARLVSAKQWALAGALVLGQSRSLWRRSPGPGLCTRTGGLPPRRWRCASRPRSPADDFPDRPSSGQGKT